MKRHIYTIFILLILCSACNIYFVMGDKDLGSNYYLLEEGRLTSVIFSTKKPYNGSGLEVIPFEVIKCNFNDSYIILKTLDNKTKEQKYWIINKNIEINLDDCYNQESCDSLLQSNVSGPLDSVNFHDEKSKKNIYLEFD